MRHQSIDPDLFIENRRRLTELLAPNSLVIVNANDVPPTNADGSLMMQPNSDLFYLSGIEQEESILLLYPDAFNKRQREILFLREPNEHLKTWEGHKLSKKEATAISGIEQVKWLSDFRGVFHSVMCDAERVYLNSNEHKRAVVDVASRDARFIAMCQRRYPLHEYHRVARLMHQIRAAKSDTEIAIIQEAVQITGAGFRRAAKFIKPGVMEYEIEAEFMHEFIRRRAKMAYSPIIAGGGNACILHYVDNDQALKKGELLLMDVAANYANYNADLTRTLPVSGQFTPRHRKIYNAVLRVMRQSIAGAVVGKLHKDWQKDGQAMMNDELLSLGLLKPRDIKKQTEDEPACRKYFMHGLGHLLGLDVHDVGFSSQPFAEGWVLTVEPGIYIPDEGIGIRLENDVLVTNQGPIDLMADIPVEADAIEDLMNRR